MPITVELQDMFRYSWIPVAIAVIVVVVVGVAGLVYFIKHNKTFYLAKSFLPLFLRFLITFLPDKVFILALKP